MSVRSTRGWLDCHAGGREAKDREGDQWHTHQTVGIHEVPWDFYRYSDQAWKGIFNRFTGFDILDTGMTLPTMIIPIQWQRQFDHTERALGFMTSACVVRKIGEPTVDCPVTVPSVTADMYPH